MKSFRILIILLVIGAFQANATGFSHNMNHAQKMLKTKKERVVIKNTSNIGKKRVASGVRAEEKEEARGMQFDKSVALDNQSLHEIESPIREKVLGSLTQWVSQWLMAILSTVLGK